MELYKTAQKSNTYDTNSDLNRSSWNALRIGLNGNVPVIILGFEMRKV